MNVGLKIKSELRLSGMTVSELASRLCFSRQYVSDLKNGRRRVSTEAALRLSIVFNTSIYYWLDDSILKNIKN